MVWIRYLTVIPPLPNGYLVLTVIHAHVVRRHLALFLDGRGKQVLGVGPESFVVSIRHTLFTLAMVLRHYLWTATTQLLVVLLVTHAVLVIWNSFLVILVVWQARNRNAWFFSNVTLVITAISWNYLELFFELFWCLKCKEPLLESFRSFRVIGSTLRRTIWNLLLLINFLFWSLNILQHITQSTTLKLLALLKINRFINFRRRHTPKVLNLLKVFLNSFLPQTLIRWISLFKILIDIPRLFLTLTSLFILLFRFLYLKNSCCVLRAIGITRMLSRADL